MLPHECLPTRRNFLKIGAAIAAGVSGLALAPQPVLAQEDQSWLIGPQKGYTPEIGTLVSMMAFTRMQVLQNVKGLSQQDLDFLLDAKANTIGALLMHLAATETYYGMNSFGAMKWNSWSDEIKKKWDIPMNLDEPARKSIKGNNLDYYLNTLHESREKNLAELKKRDDKWLTVVDTEMGMNNFAKWFHVAEHESNHDGQIKFLKGRLPGAKPNAG
jgi:uncharacterized damage-inducible protein DinB